MRRVSLDPGRIDAITKAALVLADPGRTAGVCLLMAWSAIPA